MTGKQDIGDKTYYFNESDGSSLSGWQTIDDKLYYFYPEGYMAKSKTITKKEGTTFVKYIIDEDGVATILK